MATAACLFGIAAPVASANPGDLVARVIAPEATSGVSVAFDGRILYYTNGLESLPDGTLAALIHRVTPQGVALTPIVVHGLPDFTGISALAYDVTRDMFWAVDDLTGRQVYLVDKLGNTELKFIITDDKLPGECKTSTIPGASICNPKVDGLAYDAQKDTIWYSPDESHRIYHFAGTGVGVTDVPGVPGATGPLADLLGFYDIDNPDSSSMLPDCTPFSSGIAVGDHGGTTAQNSPTAVMYDFAGSCNSWFKYLGDNFNHPVKQAVYHTYNAGRAEDDECDDVTFKVPVVWVRDEDDNLLRAFEVPTCFLGGGIPIQDKNRMTGGGGLPLVFPADPGKSAHHGFMVHCFSFIQPDRLEINWGQGNSFHMTNITSSTCDNDPNATGSSAASFDRIQGSGTGRLNGVEGATATWSFTDNGEPGTKDHGSLMVTVPFGPSCIVPNDLPDFTNGCVVMKADGLLTKDGPLIGEGNYQAHQGH